MTRDEVVTRFTAERAAFDRRIEAMDAASFNRIPPGRAHSPKEIVAHVTAYERLIVERLRAARAGETTAFDRDRAGWQPFNERVWRETAGLEDDEVRAQAGAVFADLLDEVARLTDKDLNESTALNRFIDPAWLEGRALWELVAIDGFDHYPMHFAALDDALVEGEDD